MFASSASRVECRPDRRRHKLRSFVVVVTAGAVTALTGCGSHHASAAKTASVSDVTQAVSLNFVHTAAADHPQSIAVGLGKVLYVQVSSDVEGTVSIAGYGVAQKVAAGGKTVLVISADNPGSFDVVMRAKDVSSTIGRLEVGKK
jgi:hypothetical protein